MHETGKGKPALALQTEFERATANILESRFGLRNVQCLGQRNSKKDVPDGRIEMAGRTVIWDNKATESQFKWSKKTERAIKDYIEAEKTCCRLCLIIAPRFADSVLGKVKEFSNKLGPDVDIALVTAEAFKRTAMNWEYSDPDESAERFLAEFCNTELFE